MASRSTSTTSSCAHCFIRHIHGNICCQRLLYISSASSSSSSPSIDETPDVAGPPHSMTSAPSSVRTRQTSSSTSAAKSVQLHRQPPIATTKASLRWHPQDNSRTYPDKQLKHQSNTHMGDKSSTSWQSSPFFYLLNSHLLLVRPYHGLFKRWCWLGPFCFPMTPVRSSTTTSSYTGHSLIQQRRVDPLIFGGADGLWDTIAPESKGSDVTISRKSSGKKKKSITKETCQM